MNDIGKPERVTQNRVIKLFVDELKYKYLGDWTDRDGNNNVEEGRLAPWLKSRGYTPAQTNAALYKLRTEADNNSRNLYGNNEEVYKLLRYGVQVKTEASELTATVQLIDWEHPAENDFAIAEEVTLKGNHERRPDLVLYVNGVAIGVIELKCSRVSIGDGIRQSLSNQKPEFNAWFFSTVQFVFAGNDSEGLQYGELWEPECTHRSSVACEGLAELYEDGKGVTEDSTRAAVLYERVVELETQSCDAGNGKACGELGLSYSVGHRVSHNYVSEDDVKAAEFYLKACNLGVAAFGCRELGTSYEIGKGVPQSVDRAEEYYMKACDLGEPEGCTHAGDLYHWGLYAPQDSARALGLYSRACDGGDDRGCYELGDLFRDGDGVKKNVSTAKYYYSKACALSKDLHFGCDELKKLQ